MKKAHWLALLLALGLLVALFGTVRLELAQPASADPVRPPGLGPKAASASGPIGSAFVIRADSEQEVYPALAYNSQREEYLAVWYNDRAGCDDIRAQRVSRNGTLVGGPFYISAGCNDDRRYPDVAYNSKHNEYLVVWEHYDGLWYNIHGRRVSGTGQVLDTTDIVIISGSNMLTPANPAVAYAYTSDKYLVVWQEAFHPTITTSIVGQVVSSSGSLDGTSFTISQDPSGSPRREPDVAYNRHANRYLVVWQQKAGALWDIHGQQVHGGGGLYQSDITIAYYTKSSTAPAVAAIPTTPTNYKFLVVWELLYAPNDRDIFGRLVAEDGTPGTDFWISWANGLDESSPAVAGTESNLQYFVVWRHPLGVVDKPIRGRAISHGGALVGQVAEFSGVNADYPAVAAGPVGDFLVAWQDQPVFATNTNIYGQLWGNRVYLPMILKNYQ